jgi:Calcineurin-like phosphoesterase
MQISILHLSDLHRDLSNELGNKPLLESLVQDVEDHYGSSDPIIPKPSLCIVSGDLVFGVPEGAPDADNELRRQYKQAEEFLIGLADRLFGGDRERIVLVPGNHDVSMRRTIDACREIPSPKDEFHRAKLVASFFTRRTKLRWSWKKLCFYEIVDDVMYRERLAHFAEAYRSFYQGARNFSLDPAEQFGIFDFPDLNFTVLGLCSCYENDPLNQVAAVHPDALAAGTGELRSAKYSGRLLAAVWHHSLSGAPPFNDYVDPEMLLHLIYGGISLGFHGHQHRAQCIEERKQVAGERRKIVIVSAATLCAGPSQLSPGQPRGYNIVVVDTADYNCRIHQRRMSNTNFNYPIWVPGQFTETNGSYLDILLDKPGQVRPPDLDTKLKIESAQELLSAGRWGEVVALLRGEPKESIARPLLVKAISEIDDPQITVECLWPPLTIPEAVQLGYAILTAGTREQAMLFLSLDIVTQTKDASVAEIVARIRSRWPA